MRQRVREVAGPLGMAGGAMAACCTIHLIILAGGVGTATGFVGGWLRNPYVIVAGLLLITAGLGALILRRVGRRKDGDDTCCPPATGHAGTSAVDAPPIATPRRTDTVVGAVARNGR